MRLVKQAWRDGFRDLACIIAIIWDTQFQPADVRTLAARHRHVQDDRLVFNRLDEGRQKTGKPIVGTLSRRTERLVKTCKLGLSPTGLATSNPLRKLRRP